ncbi:hypothetical protein MNB_SM-5-1518 [hydrothermal vent metagenome]|uniref:Uncharacterized protein n=1 Tax=hydrothermal vent metagenome TaxID=652676 RepID=A0A1W1C6K5_9ZZZZ
MPTWIKFLFYLTVRIVITIALLALIAFLLWWLLYSLFY